MRQHCPEADKLSLQNSKNATTSEHLPAWFFLSFYSPSPLWLVTACQVLSSDRPLPFPALTFPLGDVTGWFKQTLKGILDREEEEDEGKDGKMEKQKTVNQTFKILELKLWTDFDF